MPTLQQYHTTAIRGTCTNECPLAIHLMGLDIVGPFPMAIRQLKFLVVGIDYFTKWVKAKPLATIAKKNV